MAHAGGQKFDGIVTVTVLMEGSHKWIICRPVVLDTFCHTLSHIGAMSCVDWQIKPCESKTQELT